MSTISTATIKAIENHIEETNPELYSTIKGHDYSQPDLTQLISNTLNRVKFDPEKETQDWEQLTKDIKNCLSYEFSCTNADRQGLLWNLDLFWEYTEELVTTNSGTYESLAQLIEYGQSIAYNYFAEAIVKALKAQ